MFIGQMRVGFCNDQQTAEYEFGGKIKLLITKTTFAQRLHTLLVVLQHVVSFHTVVRWVCINYRVA